MNWQGQIEAYRSMFDTIGVAIALYDAKGRILQCNRLFTEMAGRISGCGEEGTVFSRLGGSDALRKYLTSALGGESAEAQIGIACRDKTTLYVLIRWGPLTEGEEIFGGYIILSDITKQRQREEWIKERYTRLHSLLSKALLGIVVINQDHKVVEANQRFTDMLGYSMEEVKRLHTWDWEVNMSEEEIRKQFSNLSKVNTIFQTRHRRKDGSVYDVSVCAAGTIIQGRRGEYNAVICICEDISAQKETERKLVQSEKKYRNFVENAADILYIVNESGIVLYVSSNCERMLGFTPAEIKGRHFSELMELDRREYYIQRVGEFFRTGDISYAEVVLRDKKGKKHWYGIKSTVSADEMGTPILICSARNIDDKKEYEEKLKYLSNHDQLTGIFNRNYFNAELERQYAAGEFPFTIVSCDIDGLKVVNDTYGHDAGDEMLKTSAQILRSSLREQDVLARIGGDEFAIILPRADTVQAEKVLRKIRANFARHRAKAADHVRSISLGYATVRSADMPLSCAIKRADANMYIDKRAKDR